MAFNWHISVGNPVLVTGQYFVVRYKKMPSGSWIDFLPNPTTNLFTIPALEEGQYTAEIRVYCLDGTISAPKYITKTCGDIGTPPVVNIFWEDIGGTSTRPCVSTGVTYPISYNATDLENDIVLIEVQESPDGINWTTIGIIPIDQLNYVISTSESTILYRFRVTDAQNNVSISNVLQVQCSDGSGSGSGSSGTGSGSGTSSSDGEESGASSGGSEEGSDGSGGSGGSGGSDGGFDFGSE